MCSYNSFKDKVTYKQIIKTNHNWNKIWHWINHKSWYAIKYQTTNLFRNILSIFNQILSIDYHYYLGIFSFYYLLASTLKKKKRIFA